ATGRELYVLEDSNTFTVLDKLPAGANAIASLWIFSFKHDKDIMIVMTKAGLVAQDFMQREGVDFFQTAAPPPAAA
ncbi:unnamed protein product, partial [Hapterophycus canaliculatus]